MIEFTRSNGCDIVRLEVPGKIEYRNMFLRVVSAACKMAVPNARERGRSSSEFAAQVLSAVGEAYNNVVLHGYAGGKPGSVQLQLENCPDCLRVIMMDTGVGFDPFQAKTPDLDELPESGLGIFIMRSFVDQVTYVAGCPNVLTLVKRLDKCDRGC